MTAGGMIGYVLNGPCVQARDQVSKRIAESAAALSLIAGTGLDASALRPGNDDIRQTRHDARAESEFVVHHVFLAADASPT